MVNNKISNDTKKVTPTVKPRSGAGRGRGRPKRFDRECALASALERFRRDGYSETATGAIAADCGGSPTSLYAEFPTKLRLFAATLKNYELDMAHGFSAIDRRDRDALPRNILAWAARAYSEAGPYGCLVFQHIAEAADPAVRACAIEACGAFEDLIEKTLAEAGWTDATRRAQILVVAMMGLSAMARRGLPQDTLMRRAADLAAAAAGNLA